MKSLVGYAALALFGVSYAAAAGAGCAESTPTLVAGPTPAGSAATDGGDTAAAPDSTEPASAGSPGDDVIDKRIANIKASFIAQDAHDASGIASFFTVDAIIKAPGTPDWKGRDLIRAEEQKSFDESPDVKFGARRILCADEVAIVEWTATGTATLTKKTGARPYGANGVSVMWFSKESLIKEEHDIMNAPTVIAQTGASKGKVREVLLQPSGTPDVRIGKNTPDEQKNVEASKAFDHALEARDEKTWADLVADDIAWDDYGAPAPISGKGDVSQAFTALGVAFPDQKLTCKTWAIEDIIAKECTRTGTHDGILPLGSLKVPPSHRFVESHFIDIVQWKHGKMQKGTRYEDNLEMATQLGLVGPEKNATKKKK